MILVGATPGKNLNIVMAQSKPFDDFVRDLKLEIQEQKDKLEVVKSALDFSGLKRKIESLEPELSDPKLWNDPKIALKITSEYKRTNNLVSDISEKSQNLDELEQLLDIAKADSDLQSLEFIKTELEKMKASIEPLELKTLLNGLYDKNDAIVEIHAGAGGTDAQDWAQMLLNMYIKWSQKRNYDVEIDEITPGQEAGILSATMVVKGEFAYGLLSTEKGVHRLVRISPFDSNHRRHTSFAALDVTPLIEDDFDDFEIDPNELRIDTYRASGAGGQHVNVTDSAVRITHIPTNIVATCQNERSQLQNKERAMQILRSRLLELKRKEREAEIDSLSAPNLDIAWGNQIRSYVLAPYQLVKDLRTNYEVGNVEAVLNGEIDDFIQEALKHFKKPVDYR